MEIPGSNPFEMGKNIADFGFVIMAAAGYLVYSAIIIIFFIKWLHRMLDSAAEERRRQALMEERHRQMTDEMLQLLKELRGAIRETSKAVSKERG